MILLAAINSKYIHSNPAVYYLKAYANEHGIQNSDDVLKVEEFTINQNIEEILSDIYRQAPDVLAISCYIWNREMIDRVLEDLPKILPECRVLLGGPEASNDAEAFLEKYSCVDAIFIGEGEETFYEVCKVVEELEAMSAFADQLKNIPGLCLRSGYTKVRAQMPMDEVPFFYGEWADNWEESPFNNKIIYYETSRGCPFNCSYCLSCIDRTVRLRNLDKVFDELQFFIDRKVPQVKFVDRTFNCNTKHAEAIWQYILEHDNGITNFHFEISADIMKKSQLEIIRKMRPGLIQLEIGVQSTNPDTLKAINRFAPLDKIRENVAAVKSFGNIHQHLDLIAGLPYEDLGSFKKSFNDVYSMEPDQLQLGFLKVLNGADIAGSVEKYGINWSSRAPYEVISTKWISYKDVIKLKQVEEVVELFYNSCQFVKTMSVLEKEFDSPFEMFEKLADYFEKNGYFKNHPARVYRYNVLLAFACATAPEKEELFKELLTCDIYLRENMKSRPGFARELVSYKKEIYARSKSKKDHIEVFYYDLISGSLEKSKEPHYVLFDYDDRDPLSNNAKMVEIY